MSKDDDNTTNNPPAGESPAKPEAPQAPQISPEMLAQAIAALPPEQRPFMNKSEIVENFKELRDLKKWRQSVEEKTASTPSKQTKNQKDEPAEDPRYAELEKRLAQSELAMALVTSDTKLSADQFKALQALQQIENPDDLHGWATEKAKSLFGVIKDQPKQSEPKQSEPKVDEKKDPLPPRQAPDMPPAERNQSAFILPDNPNQADLSVLGSMDREKRMEYLDRWMAKNGGKNWMRGKRKH